MASPRVRLRHPRLVMKITAAPGTIGIDASYHARSCRGRRNFPNHAPGATGGEAPRRLRASREFPHGRTGSRAGAWSCRPSSTPAHPEIVSAPGCTAQCVILPPSGASARAAGGGASILPHELRAPAQYSVCHTAAPGRVQKPTCKLLSGMPIPPMSANTPIHCPKRVDFVRPWARLLGDFAHIQGSEVLDGLEGISNACCPVHPSFDRHPRDSEPAS